MSARFLYLVIGEFSGEPSWAEVVAAGKLEYAMPAGCLWAATHCDAGALGKGILCAVGSMIGFDYSTETHDWHSMKPERPNAYIGVPKVDKPGPQDLLNPGQMLSEGKGLELNDGNVWHIPTVRFLYGMTDLPRVLAVDADGNIAWKTKREFRDLFDMSERIVRRLLEERDSKYSAAETAMWTATALGVNYRIGVDEVCHLSLISSENLPQISNVIMDADKLAALLASFQKAAIVP